MNEILIKIKNNTLVKIIAVLLLLYLFLSAITLMSTSFKLMGKSFSEGLITITTSPFMALFMGILTTAIVQSSSVTTSLVVGLVSSGALSVANAVPIIMGANIGTTITNTIVSLGHLSNKREFRRAFAGSMIHDFFNSFSVIILFPIEMATGILQTTATKMAELFYGSHASIEYHSPVKAAASIIPQYLKNVLTKGWDINEKIAGITLLVLSFIVIFATLVLFVKIMRSVVMSKIEQILNNFLNKSPFVGLAIGMIITAMVQSSSITTSLLIPLFGTGILTLEAAFPITLGANVGTTVTALLAALAGNMAGLTIAFVHLLFNMFGILIIYPARKIRRIPLLAATLLARSAAKNKKILAFYILGFFFFLPILLIFINRLF